MDFIYHNRKTGTFAEFSMEIGEENSHPVNAIDSLLNIFLENTELVLPNALLKLLTEDEINLFLMLPYSEEYKAAVEDMLYVSSDGIVYDEHQTPYHIEYIGKNRTIISYETLDNMKVFNVASSAIHNHKISFQNLRFEEY